MGHVGFLYVCLCMPKDLMLQPAIGMSYKIWIPKECITLYRNTKTIKNKKIKKLINNRGQGWPRSYSIYIIRGTTF